MGGEPLRPVPPCHERRLRPDQTLASSRDSSALLVSTGQSLEFTALLDRVSVRLPGPVAGVAGARGADEWGGQSGQLCRTPVRFGWPFDTSGALPRRCTRASAPEKQLGISSM